MSENTIIIEPVAHAPIALALPAPEPRIIEVPAVITRRETYVPDESIWIDRAVYSLTADHGIGVDESRITGDKDAGAWRHEYRTALDLTVSAGESRALSIFVYGSNNKRRSLRIVAGAFTFVCGNGLFFGRTELDVRTRHTMHVRSRAFGILASMIRRLPEFQQQQLETDRQALQIEFNDRQSHELNYRGFLSGAWSADVARLIAREIDQPRYADFRQPTLYHQRERFTTVFRDLQPNQQARALESLRALTVRP